MLVEHGLPLEQSLHPVQIGQQVLLVAPAVGQRVAQGGPRVVPVGSHPLGEPLEAPVVLRVGQVGSHPLGEPLEVPVVLRVGQVASR